MTLASPLILRLQPETLLFALRRPPAAVCHPHLCRQPGPRDHHGVATNVGGLRLETPPPAKRVPCERPATGFQELRPRSTLPSSAIHSETSLSSLLPSAGVGIIRSRIDDRELRSELTGGPMTHRNKRDASHLGSHNSCLGCGSSGPCGYRCLGCSRK